jgi:hypothetical protein
MEEQDKFVWVSGASVERDGFLREFGLVDGALLFWQLAGGLASVVAVLCYLLQMLKKPEHQKT